MKVLIIGQCTVDGCYKKVKKGCGMCTKHEEDYQAGEKLSVNYGRTVQKPRKEEIDYGLNKEKQQEFEELAKPLIKWLNENTNPHTKCIIGYRSASLVSDEYRFFTDDYIR